MTSRKSELRSIPFWSPALVLCLLCTPLLLGQIRRSWTHFHVSTSAIALNDAGNLYVTGVASGAKDR
jgi:hypothetical protein